MQDIKSEQEFTSICDKYTAAKGFLVDSHATGKAGGTGKTFDWQNVHKNYKRQIILAGGLNPEYVADAMQQTDVYGIDLSSGVESQPGIKDQQQNKALMQEVYRVQCNQE